MPQSTFQQAFGIGTVEVFVSFEGNGSSAITAPKIRQGLAGIVTSVARSNTGIYTITFSQKMGRLVNGSNDLELASADDKIAAGFNYDASGQLVVTLWYRDLSAAGLADPAAGSRLHFRGVFSPRTDLRDAA